MTAYAVIVRPDRTAIAYAYGTRIEASLAPVRGDDALYVLETEADTRTLVNRTLVGLFNALTDTGVTKFESHAAGTKRLLSVLPTVSKTPPVLGTPTTTNPKEIKVTDIEKKPRVSKMQTGKPANPDKFKAGRVRPGTARAQILDLMDGTLTAPEVDKEMGFEKAGYSLSHFYCLARDCGVGYSFDEAGRVSAVYPPGESLDTAIGEPAQPKAKKEKKAA